MAGLVSKGDKSIILRDGSNVIVTSNTRTIKDLSNNELREYSAYISERSYKDNLHLAESLFYIYKNILYTKWTNKETGEKYKSFTEYVECELKRSLRTARYFLSIWTWFGVTVGSEKVLKKFETVGWGKLKDLVEVVDESNMDEWYEKATTLSCEELAVECRAALVRKRISDGTVDPDDEEVKKANDNLKQIRGRGDRATIKRDINNNKPLKTITFKVDNDQHSMIKDAMTRAHEISDRSFRPELFSFIAQDFVATNMFKTGHAKKSDLITYLRKLESLLPHIKLIIVDTNEDEIIYGLDTLNKCIELAVSS